MPIKISVYMENGTYMGKGVGEINRAARTATIQTWTDMAGLKEEKKYKLEADGKPYTATCESKSNTPPVATFIDLD
jgi:hypothetical protein